MRFSLKKRKGIDMFSEFNEYLKAFEMENYAVNYWYNEGFSIAQEMLEKFSEEEWIELKNSLLSKSIGWKRRLAYCCMIIYIS